MATALTEKTVVGPFPALPVAANALDFTFAAADAVNGNSFKLTGKELLVVRNVDGVNAHTFTITSSTDERKRTGDITGYSLGPGEFAAFSFRSRDAHQGWRQADGTVLIDADDVQIEFAVLRV